MVCLSWKTEFNIKYIRLNKEIPCQESPGWVSFFVVVENILKPQFFFGKIDLSMNSGRRRVGDS